MRHLAGKSRILWSLLLIFVVLSSNLFALFSATQVLAVGQLSARKLTLGSSKVSTSNTYSVSFTPATTTSVKAIVVDFCAGSVTTGPLIGTACSSANHPVSAIATSGSVSVAQTGTTGSPWTFTAVTPNSNIGSGKALVIQLSAGTGALSTSTAVTFSFTATNPSTVGTFYARILSFSTTADSTTYDSTTTGAANPGSNVIDDGSVALSTANQLTINARVQEQLSFCVGGTTVNDATTAVATDCSVSFAGSGSCGSGTTVDLGVIDNTATNVTPVSTGNGGNTCNGAAMVQTNASEGVAVSYFAQSNGTNHVGALRIAGATCSGSIVSTDQCFNSSTTQSVFTKGTEDFGVTVAAVNCGATTSYTCVFTSGNYSLIRAAQYDGTGGNTYPTDGVGDNGRVLSTNTNAGYAWDDGAGTQTLADSSAGSLFVVDTEALILKFAATASPVTPNGQYTVTSVYIATATF